MKRKKVDTIWLLISIGSFLAVAISILMMPSASGTSSADITPMRFIPGAIFWVSLILGTVSQIILARRRRQWFFINNKEITKNEKIGIISFFSCPLASLFDIAFVISLIGFIISAALSAGYIVFLLLSVLVFSFAMHCILNGKIYYHILSRQS